MTEKIKQIVARVILSLALAGVLGLVVWAWWEAPRFITLTALGIGAFMWALDAIGPYPVEEEDDGLDTEPYREDKDAN